MEKYIRSHKWQEEVRYNEEDIAWDGKEWTAPGIGKRTGIHYTITFDDMPQYNEFWCRDIKRSK